MSSQDDFHNLPIGGIYVTGVPMTITTVLGSCISICLYDRQNRVSGMNHYMLPRMPRGGQPKSKEIGRYGDLSIPELVKQFRQKGGDLKRSTAKIFGGAHMLLALKFANIPDANIEVAEEYLESVGVKVVNREVGGERGRKVIFQTETGKVMVREVAKREFD